MKKLKNIFSALFLIIIAIITVTQLSLAEGHDFEDNLNLDTMLDMAQNEDTTLINADAGYLTSHYANGFGLSVGVNGDWSNYAGRPTQYMDCINESFGGSGFSYDMGYNIISIIDISSDGTVSVTSNGSTRAITDEYDREVLYKMGVIGEAQIRGQGLDQAGGWMYLNPDVMQRSGVLNYNASDYDVTAFDKYDCEKTINQYGGQIRAGYRVRIFVMRVGLRGQQDSYWAKTGQERILITSAPDSPEPGIVRLIKVGVPSEKRLPGVKFMIERTSKDSEPSGFIQVVDLEKNDANMKKENETLTGVGKDEVDQGKTELRYTPIENDATVFVTDGNGEIYIYGLMSGTYVAKEIENPIPGYEMEPNTISFNVSGSLTTESVIRAENEYSLTDIELDKTDMTSGEAIDGAGFKIKTDKGEWVKDSNSENPYDKLTTNEEEATEYFTVGGKIVVRGLPNDRTYTWVETTFPDNPETGGKYVALDKDGGGLSVTGKKGETVSVEAQNKPVGLFRKVIKGTDKGIQGVPFEFKEYSIADEYPELMEGFTVGSASYAGSLADEHCTYNTCDEVDTQVPHYEVRWDGTTYVWYTCSLHNLEGPHADAWEARRAEYNSDVEKANNCHHAREEGVKEINEGTNGDNKRNNLTDENGNIDISPLVPDGDDGKGKFQYREIDEGMENPYFNNDHPDWTDFDYLGKTVVEDERRRMDIEGLIWLERSELSKESIDDDPETKGEGDEKGIYQEGLDQLFYPVEVCLKNGDPNGESKLIGEGVITADGRYRIRVGGKDGSDLDYITKPELRQNTYVEFTYNGMKYQSVFEPTLENEENGSKAMETEEARRKFNERYKTIISNKGDEKSSKAVDNTIINYEKLEENGEYAYKRRVLYEGQIDGIKYPEGQSPSEVFGGKDEDPIGDGVYSGLELRPKAGDVDEKYTMQQESNGDTSIYSDNVYTYQSPKTGGDKYQIKADTKTAGYQGFNNYNIEDDKIEHVNLGVYERTQPDIAIVNDIERVRTHINNEEYIYQYGSNTSKDKQIVDESEKYDVSVEGRFQSNVSFKYKRYIKPEQIQVNQEEQNTDEQDRFEMTIYYRTEVINQSSYLYMQPEIRTQYDEKYEPDVRDATGEVIGDKKDENGANMGEWQETSPLGGTNSNENKPDGYQERYNTMIDAIAPGETKVFYTAYTLHRENLEELIKYSKQMYFFNNIEVNAYTTTWKDEKGQERPVNEDGAYAAIDEDSAPGNSKPSTNYVQQEDGSWKPSDIDPTGEETFEDDNDIAPVFELNREEPAKISGTVFLDDIIKGNANAKSVKDVDGDGQPDVDRDAGEVQEYLGDGKNKGAEEGDIPVAGVKVELVELLENGDEILETAEDGTKTTKVQLLDPDKATLNTDRVAQMITDDTGTYSFEGFIPGEYIIKFTWGQNVVYKGKGIDNYQYDKDASTPITTTYKVTTQDESGKNIEEDRIAYVQQYKSTVFDGEERYNKMTDMKGETTTKNRWYIDGSDVDYSGKSNAIDDMELRRKIDNDILNIGNNYEKDPTQPIQYGTGTSTDNEKMLTYPDLEEKEDPYNVFAGRATSIVSRTPAFDVGQQGLDNDKDDVNKKNEVYDLNDTKDVSGEYAPINIEKLDFGISERPKQNMELEKRIERVSVKLANGQTLVDANVLWKENKGNSREQRMEIEDITGEIKQVTYPKFEDNDIGTFKMEVDKEILQGSTMEITYKYNIINESNLDYVISDEEKTKEGKAKASLPYEFQGVAWLNRYYKYGNGYNDSIQETEVEMSPSIIIDYLDNAMAWNKYNEVDYHENDLWEEVTEDENKDSSKITDLLYDGRFDDGNNILYEKNKDLYNQYYGTTSIKEQIDNIYKFYRTILRDTTAKNMDKMNDYYSDNTKYPEKSEQLEKVSDDSDRYKGQVYLKAKQISYDDVKFIASKELSDTNIDLNFYNVAEIAQINRTGGAIPEEIIPGDTDATEIGHTDMDNPNNSGNSTVTQGTVEHDGGWASVVTITPPTGDSTNYNYMVWATVGIVGLTILGVGTLGIKKVLVPNKIEQPKEDSKEDK